ncbi:MAG: tetratricopeptide repeat protein [Desulfuromonadaceae bacterium]|nr:tetratricopeptide repeat protein [Desulfuromonadaceae bacterium]
MTRVKGILTIVLCTLLLISCSATKEKVDAGEVHYILGVSYLRENNPTLALKEFLIAYDSENSGRVHSGLGQAYQLKRAFKEAEEHYKTALRRDENNPQFANNLAALYLDMGRWDAAIKYFNQAADNLLFTTPEIALTGLGVAYYQKGEYPQAIIQFEKSINLAPRFAQTYYHLGETYFALDKPDLALLQLNHAIDLSPAYAAAYYKRALTYLKLKNNVAAKTDFMRVLALVPDNEIGRLSKDYLRLLK